MCNTVTWWDDHGLTETEDCNEPTCSFSSQNPNEPLKTKKGAWTHMRSKFINFFHRLSAEVPF